MGRGAVEPGSAAGTYSAYSACADCEDQVGASSGLSLYRSDVSPNQLQERPGKKAIRFDQRRFFTVAGFGEYLGGQTEGSAYAHRPQSQRHRATAGEWNVATRADFSRYADAIQHGVEPRSTWAVNQVRHRQRQGMARSYRLQSGRVGTPAKLRTSGSASIEDFRRYDITSGNALRLAANCDAEYSSLNHEFHEVLCSAPVAQGLVTLSGDVGLPGSHRFAVLVKAENVPANGLVALVQHAKKNLPDDLTAEGTLSGSLSMQEDTAREIQFHPEGRGGIDNFRLVSVSNKTEFGPVTLPFLLDGQSAD